jgi:hypothetical protein
VLAETVTITVQKGAWHSGDPMALYRIRLSTKHRGIKTAVFFLFLPGTSGMIPPFYEVSDIVHIPTYCLGLEWNPAE